MKKKIIEHANKIKCYVIDVKDKVIEKVKNSDSKKLVGAMACVAMLVSAIAIVTINKDHKNSGDSNKLVEFEKVSEKKDETNDKEESISDDAIVDENVTEENAVDAPKADAKGSTGSTDSKNDNKGSTSSSKPSTSKPGSKPSASHKHDYQPVYKYHPAVKEVGHNVYHREEYYMQGYYRTSDGKEWALEDSRAAQEYAAINGLSISYAEKKVVTKPAWNEWVVTTPAKAAWNELIGYQCAHDGTWK